MIFIFPAYCANGMPVIFGGGRTIDGGGKFLDGKPIFGSHKTFRGFLAGMIIGTSVGFAEQVLFVTFHSSPFLSIIPFSPSPFLGLTLSLGALLGDLADSFIKRRLNIPPGSPLPLVDQLDFVAGALLFSLIIGQLPSPLITLIVIVITPPIHLLTNFSAYLLGFKREWW
ncbi:MAG: CDP-2,3-bis-(O-geranylgeranyl)-sn-glycerol synthase [Candidatus Bathyarchaeota archaeon]|nr:MAG: CDP-2,3-bis-(O-geranylgeranyl)-sn-glycerol synthase [Candidatus Bathyarchaeota archaeon]